MTTCRTSKIIKLLPSCLCTQLAPFGVNCLYQIENGAQLFKWSIDTFVMLSIGTFYVETPWRMNFQKAVTRTDGQANPQHESERSTDRPATPLVLYCKLCPMN